MKKIFYLLVIALLASCAKESEQVQVTRQADTDSPMQAQPMFKTKKCNKIKNAEERTRCAADQLMDELKDIVYAAQDKNPKLINTKLIVEFDIETNGKVSNVNISKKVDPNLDLAVAKYISRTQWSPAVFEGEKRKITRRLPVYID